MNPKPLTDKQRYWLTHIEHCQEAGQSLASYAQENSLDLNALYRWKVVCTMYSFSFMH